MIARALKFLGLERRASYTDLFVDAVLRSVSGDASSITQTAAAEVAVGIWERGMRAAEVTGTDALRPHLESIGRALCAVGEWVAMRSVEGGKVSLAPACAWEIEGADCRPGS